MPAGPENRFRAAIHRRLPAKLHHEKMNNPWRGGTADDWYSGPSGDCWVEYKWVPKVPTKVLKPKLEPLQEKWLNGRFSEGRDVYVVVGCPDGGVIFSAPDEWLKGVTKPTIRSKDEIAKWLVSITMETH